MRVLLDTCVILDAMQNRGKSTKFAQMLLIGSAENKFEGCATSKQICDIYYILHKALHSNEKCRQCLNDLFEVIEIIDCSAASVINAQFSAVSDFEDAVLIECAKETNCDFIATSNVGDFKKSSLKATNPEHACEVLGLKLQA